VEGACESVTSKGTREYRRQPAAPNPAPWSAGYSRRVRAFCAKNILLVGPERPEEFASAMRLMCGGHRVLAVNPRETRMSRAFQRVGGKFIRARIENLRPSCSRFDLILENYPYPSGRDYVPPRYYALARLSRLASCGRWILFTEAIRFATLLKAVVAHDDDLREKFRVSLAPISPDVAPPSHYPPVDSRFRLVFERLG
jgi:hypothetical protein